MILRLVLRILDLYVRLWLLPFTLTARVVRAVLRRLGNLLSSPEDEVRAEPVEKQQQFVFPPASPLLPAAASAGRNRFKFLSGDSSYTREEVAPPGGGGGGGLERRTSLPILRRTEELVSPPNGKRFVYVRRDVRVRMSQSFRGKLDDKSNDKGKDKTTRKALVRQEAHLSQQSSFDGDNKADGVVPLGGCGDGTPDPPVDGGEVVVPMPGNEAEKKAKPRPQWMPRRSSTWTSADFKTPPRARTTSEKAEENDMVMPLPIFPKTKKWKSCNTLPLAAAAAAAAAAASFSDAKKPNRPSLHHEITEWHQLVHANKVQAPAASAEKKKLNGLKPNGLKKRQVLQQTCRLQKPDSSCSPAVVKRAASLVTISVKPGLCVRAAADSGTNRR